MCYTFTIMQKTASRILQAAVFMVLVAVGAWLRCLCLGDVMPLASEAPTLLAASVAVESVDYVGLPYGCVSAPSLFTRLGGACAAFFGGTANGFMTLRSYRALPMVLAVLVLALIPALGLRRRGGLFDTADGPLWAVAFAACSPALIAGAWQFDPYSLLTFLSLLFWIAARSYAQWPGYISALTVGFVSSLSLVLEANALWVILFLLPALPVGVGWRRLCLYWRTLHVALALAVAAAVWSFAREFFPLEGLSLPDVHAVMGEGGRVLGMRLLGACCGGLGLIAWAVLSAIGFSRSDRRWARVFAVVYPSFFVGAAVFPRGGVFLAPLALLSAVMCGMAVSCIPRDGRRWAIGNLVLMAQCAVMVFLGHTMLASRVPRAEQKLARATLQQAFRRLPSGFGPHGVLVVTDSPENCARLVWPVRHLFLCWQVVAPEAAVGAQLTVVEESFLDRLPADTARGVIPGRVRLASDTVFRLFCRPSAPPVGTGSAGTVLSVPAEKGAE